MNGEFRKPAGLSIDASDNVYGTDQGNDRVPKYTSDGQFIAAWEPLVKAKVNFQSQSA